MSAAPVPLEQQAREVWRASRQLRHGDAGISVGIAVKALNTAARAESDRLRRVAEQALRGAGRVAQEAWLAGVDDAAPRPEEQRQARTNDRAAEACDADL